MKTYLIDEAREVIESLDPETDNADKVRAAQSLLNAAITILDDVAKDTGDENARAYVIDQLKILASGDHGFLSNDMNLDKWIKRIERAEDDSDE